MLINLIENVPTIHPYVDQGRVMVLALTKGFFKVGDNTTPMPHEQAGNTVLTFLPLSDGDYYGRILDNVRQECRVKILQGILVLTFDNYRIQIDFGSAYALANQNRTIWDEVSDSSL